MPVKSKPFKVADFRKEDEFVGLVVRGVDDLLDKACKKFKLTRRGAHVCETDGTKVEDDEYLFGLESRAKLIVVQRGFHWTPNRAGAETIDDIADILEQFILKNTGAANRDTNDDTDAKYRRSEEVIAALEGVRSVLNSKSDVTSREDDPEWFEGVSRSFSTKERQMRYTARTRIRSYLVTAKEFVASKKDLTEKVKEILTHTLNSFEEQLREDDYFEDYFDRTAYVKDRLCDQEGWFRCEGKYNDTECFYSHNINPYSSQVTRLVFTTWNFDHVIEKSREVLPSLVEAAKLESVSRKKKVNWRYFYKCLFTTGNLKLVHISCHDKSQHSKKCDASQFLE